MIFCSTFHLIFYNNSNSFHYANKPAYDDVQLVDKLKLLGESSKSLLLRLCISLGYKAIVEYTKSCLIS